MAPRSLTAVAVLRATVLALAWLLPLRSGPARAQAPGEVDQITKTYNGAVAAFGAGQWAEAAAGFEAAMKLLPDEKAPQLPALLYLSAAAWFNAPDYAKAVEAFQKYLTKFPAGEKAGEVRLGLARATLRAQNYEEAARLFTQMENVPALREEALAAQVQAFREGGKPAQAIAVLERIIAPEIRTAAQAGGAITLAQLYAENKESAKAVALLQKLETKTALIENPEALNSVAVKLGDSFLEAQQFPEALACYRAVRAREDVLRLQKNRVAALEQRLELNVKGAAGNTQLMAQVQMANAQLRETLEETRRRIEAYGKLPDFGPALLLRMARAFYEGDTRWEAIVVYDRLLARYPAVPEREAALFGAVIAAAEVERVAMCQQRCAQYLQEFKDGPNAGTVGYLSGAVALQAQDFKGAETSFGTMLEKVPNSAYRGTMRFLLGNARFMQGNFDGALLDYGKYLDEFPAGPEAEEATFRIALAAVFAGDYEKATGLLQGYLAKYRSGAFASDARYRLLVCKYAASRYAEVLADGASWLRDFPENPQEGEVQVLIGDSHAAENRPEEAAAAYQLAVQRATTDEVLNYALFEAAKHLQKLGKWPEVAAMFEAFVRAKPDHPAVVSAMFWIGKARAREGQSEEAKTFLVANLKKYLAEPKREAVELLLQQLAQLCAKRPRGPLPAAPPSGTPAPLPPYDAAAELARQLVPLEEIPGATAKARLLYAQAELARLTKRPADADRLLLEMSARFKPEDLSPVLLAQLGDFLLARGATDQAAALYQNLREDFPKSDYLDYAYAGLGDVALARRQYPQALELFTEALEKIGATTKLKEATLGKARALFALKRHDEARKLFEQVAAVREWRGEATAFAVFSLGEIAAEQGKYAEAIALYRRVFVAYQKYLPWVAKAYLRAAESFDKLGQRQDAIDNLREMLRNEKLAKFPETEEARKRLTEWGAPA